MITFEALSADDLGTLKAMCREKGYLEGHCCEFAIAASRGLGWQLIALMNNQKVRHALVRSPDDQNMFFDSRGLISYQEIGEPFDIQPPYTLADITENDLHIAAGQKIHDIPVVRALHVAELLWPDLPWKNSTKSRMEAFAIDLETICRKHGMWIRAPYPAIQPILARADGDEAGFVLIPTIQPNTYLFDRCLE